MQNILAEYHILIRLLFALPVFSFLLLLTQPTSAAGKYDAVLVFGLVHTVEGGTKKRLLSYVLDTATGSVQACATSGGPRCSDWSKPLVTNGNTGQFKFIEVRNPENLSESGLAGVASLAPHTYFVDTQSGNIYETRTNKLNSGGGVGKIIVRKRYSVGR